MHDAKIPPERIVILGQSLGTAVASAVALNFASWKHELIPIGAAGPAVRLNDPLGRQPTVFAGIVLVAPFSSMPSLMLTYRIGGIFPVLLPLRPVPWLARRLTAQMSEKWPTAKRLAAYYETLADSKQLVSTKDDLSGDGSKVSKEMGALQIIHAMNDMDISYHQTEMICERILQNDSSRCTNGSKGAKVVESTAKGKPKVRIEIVEHGGKCGHPSWSG